MKEWKIKGLGEERKGKKESEQGRKEGKRKDKSNDRHTYSQFLLFEFVKIW